MGAELYPTADAQFSGPADDVEAVRRAHRDWWAANHTQEIPRCARNFAPQTLMFNLNGHTYYGLDEMIKAWEFYVGAIDVDMVQLWDYRIHVDGDLAVITCEGVFPTKQSTEDGWGASNLEIGKQDDVPVGVRFRETSYARRDDGDGNPVWKIWHFHCSPCAPADEARPGIGDTWEERGGARGGAVEQTVELGLNAS